MGMSFANVNAARVVIDAPYGSDQHGSESRVRVLAKFGSAALFVV